MRKLNIIIAAAVVCLMAGCTITGRISRRQTAAVIKHSTRQQRERVEEKSSAPTQGYIEYTKNDNTKSYLIPTAPGSDGKSVPTIAIQEVVVTAPSRSIPERNGKVSLDFVVTLPKELMGGCRGVEVTPVLHRPDSKVALQPLTIRGALFNRVQQRNYWQYDRYLDVYTPDDTGRQWAFNRFVYYPYPEGTRLDSVVPNRTGISYFYTQEVPTAETGGNRLLITLRGQVMALDHSYYPLPLSDTLTYNISSMLSFVDTTTRYVTRVIEKYAVVNDRAHLKFGANRTDIIDTLGDNAAQLSRIERLMDEILRQREYHVDSIILTASASPEGSVRKNDALARERAHALRERLVRKFPRSRIDTLISVRWTGEDWAELERLLRADDSNVRNRDAILEMIAAGRRDMDALERDIRRRFPDDYRRLLAELYPRLRAVGFKYDLRRVGMVKDTIHTTVPDTLYARGVALLKGRRYDDALSILGGFRDRNAAICLMSLGRDETAHRILTALPEHSTHRYLLAIVCARLGRETEALQHFSRACELNPVLQYRGRLDPEISQLSKNLTDEKDD
jgi:hypothetical protein